jgi:hypothetical protein
MPLSLSEFDCARVKYRSWSGQQHYCLSHRKALFRTSRPFTYTDLLIPRIFVLDVVLREHSSAWATACCLEYNMSTEQHECRARGSQSNHKPGTRVLQAREEGSSQRTPSCQAPWPACRCIWQCSSQAGQEGQQEAICRCNGCLPQFVHACPHCCCKPGSNCHWLWCHSRVNSNTGTHNTPVQAYS